MHLQGTGPNDAFWKFTRYLLDVRKDYNVMLSFPVSEVEQMHSELLDGIWTKPMRRCGRDMNWRTWLIEGVFPETTLYAENERDLERLLADPRFTSAPGYSSKEVYSSFFGRMSRPRERVPAGFLSYALGRWRHPRLRAMPSFYFDVESPEWVWEELARNPTQPKGYRGTVSCVMNVSLRWDTKRQTAYLALIIKHNQWSHVYGDIFGAAYFLQAFLKAVGLECSAEVCLVMMSCTMDDPKSAKRILR